MKLKHRAVCTQKPSLLCVKGMSLTVSEVVWNLVFEWRQKAANDCGRTAVSTQATCPQHWEERIASYSSHILAMWIPFV